jgi:hypothetical protein
MTLADKNPASINIAFLLYSACLTVSSQWLVFQSHTHLHIIVALEQLIPH